MSRYDWKPPAPMWRVWTNDTETVAAMTADDALAALMDSMGSGPDDHEDEEWTEVPPSKALRIRMDLYDYDAKDCPKDAKVSIEQATLGRSGRNVTIKSGVVFVEATASEWAAQNGRGVLCSTEWYP